METYSVRAAAVVLAGGASRRMGSDKALLRLPDGRAVVAAVLETARAVTRRVFLSCDTAEHAAQLLAALPDAPPPVLLDTTPGEGPLAALARALAEIETGPLLALPVDAPLVRSALLYAMLDTHIATGALAVVARIGERVQPLPALYDAVLAGAARAALAGGRRDLRALIEAAGERVCWFDEADARAHDPALLSFARCNTPDEWHALLERLG